MRWTIPCTARRYVIHIITCLQSLVHPQMYTDYVPPLPPPFAASGEMCEPRERVSGDDDPFTQSIPFRPTQCCAEVCSTGHADPMLECGRFENALSRCFFHSQLMEASLFNPIPQGSQSSSESSSSFEFRFFFAGSARVSFQMLLAALRSRSGKTRSKTS